ncbi:hypothetical protein ACRAWF_39320 [Streptomyces sp. L7]
MTRKAAARQPEDRGHVVAVVVPEPRDAVAPVERAAPGARIAVVCLRPGGKDGRAALDRALAAAEARGCRTHGGLRVLDADARDASAALAAELRAIDPDRLHTLDPDPVHTGLDETTGTLSYGVPDEHAVTAALALDAARGPTGRDGTAVVRRVPSRRADTGTRRRRQPAPPGARELALGRLRRPAHRLPADGDRRGPLVRGDTGRTPRTAPNSSKGRAVAGSAGDPGPARAAASPRAAPDRARRRRGRRGGRARGPVPHRPPSHAPGSRSAARNSAAWRKGREVELSHGRVRRGRASLRVRAQLRTQRQLPPPVGRRHLDAVAAPWRGLRVADELVAVTGEHGGVELSRPGPGHRGRTALVPRTRRDLDRGPDAPVRRASRQSGAGRRAGRGPVPAQARTGRTCFWRPGAPAAYPLDDPAPETGADGPTATARGVELAGWGYSVLLGRSADGGCALGAHPAARPDTGVWWQDTGAPSYGTPAAAVSRERRLAVAVRLPGGRLLVARRDESRDGLALGDWRPVA